jgi:hypothetical protein
MQRRVGEGRVAEEKPAHKRYGPLNLGSHGIINMCKQCFQDPGCENHLSGQNHRQINASQTMCIERKKTKPFIPWDWNASPKHVSNREFSRLGGRIHVLCAAENTDKTYVSCEWQMQTRQKAR